MKKNQPQSSADPVVRRKATDSDVEKFLQSGNKIEQIPIGVSAQVYLVSSKPGSGQEKAKQANDTTKS